MLAEHPRTPQMELLMRSCSTRTIVETSVAEWRLLTHPFYLRWSAGLLSTGELREYAAQYRHIEAAIPRLLTLAATQCTEPQARALVEQTLSDELGDAQRPSHLSLFDDFAQALHAQPAAASPATLALLGTLDELASRGAIEGLSGLAAYEVQSPDVSASKAAGLRLHHHLDDDGVAFWDVHADADIEHAGWTVEALDVLGADAGSVAGAASAAGRAWWVFLDERESTSIS
jgi:pyrroloquinoline-quinone synthase